jgi:iron complex outermembrane receptor protein
MRSFLLLLILTAAQTKLGLAQTPSAVGSISGIVMASDEGRNLSGASVHLENTVLGTVTSTDGRFFLTKVLVGKYTLVVSLVGYARKVIPDIEVKPDASVYIVIKLFPRPIQTEPVVVTATKHEESLQDVPASVSVVDGQTLMNRNAITVKDALQYVPGVRMLQDQIDIRGSTGYSQGVGSRVLLLIDGLPLLTGDTGEIVWEAIPVDEVERIEVVKGAGSALYGSSALGGVINIITRDIPDTAQTNFRVYSGFYDQPYYTQWRWSDKLRGMEGIYAGHSQRIGNFSFLTYGGYGADDGYRENDSYRRWNGFTKLEYDFSPFEQFRLTSDVVHEREASFYYWTSLADALQPDTAQEGSHITTTRWNTSLSFRNFVSDMFSYNLRGEYFNSFLRYDSSGVPGSSSLANTGTLEFQGNSDFTDSNTLTFGAVGNLDQVTAFQYGNHFGYGLATYVQDEIRVVEPLRADAGLRYDEQRIVGLPMWASVSPKLGLVLSADPATTFRASLGRGFRAPSIAELYVNAGTPYLPIVPNPYLKPEQSWSFEIGGTHFFSENIMLDWALFQSEFWNLIEADFDTTGGGMRIKFDNVSRARVQGGELDLKGDMFGKFLRFDLGYTYSWPIDLSTGTVLRFRSRHQFYASTTLDYKMISLGVDFRYISEMERLDNVLSSFIVNWDSQVPIEVVDTRATVDLTKWGFPVTIGLHVSNLFQYNYIQLPGNLGPIRNFVVSMEGKL